MDGDSAFWSMTINNYDATDLALVQQGYPDFIRQIVYTLERGEETGTPHIQAYIKLFRGQRMSYVKKLFPRGSFRQLKSDEYRLNTQRYAQKLDKTAESPAVINNNPFPDAVNELLSVIEGAYQWYGEGRHQNHIKEKEWLQMLHMEQMNRVQEKPHLAKFYISAQYKTLVKEYFWSFVGHVFRKREAEEREKLKNSGHTHTHTHTDEKFSQSVDIPIYNGSREDDEESECTESEGEDDESDQESESETSCSDNESWSSRSSSPLTL